MSTLQCYVCAAECDDPYDDVRDAERPICYLCQYVMANYEWDQSVYHGIQSTSEEIIKRSWQLRLERDTRGMRL